MAKKNSLRILYQIGNHFYNQPLYKILKYKDILYYSTPVPCDLIRKCILLWLILNLEKKRGKNRKTGAANWNLLLLLQRVRNKTYINTC